MLLPFACGSAFFQYLPVTRLGVEGRFFRVVSYITYSENQGRWIWEQLSLLKELERDAIEMNAPAFVSRPTSDRLDLY